MDFFDNPKRVVTLWTKSEGQKDKGTYTTGYRNRLSGETENEILVNGAEWVKYDTGFVHTEVNQLDGTLTIIIQRRSLTGKYCKMKKKLKEQLDDEDPIVEVLNTTVEDTKYFQGVIWQKLKKDDKWTLTKPDMSYKQHATKAAKDLARVNSNNRIYEGITYDTSDKIGFSQLDTKIEFGSSTGRKEVRILYNSTPSKFVFRFYLPSIYTREVTTHQALFTTINFARSELIFWL